MNQLKKILLVVLIVALAFSLIFALAGRGKCTTIQSGNIYSSTGEAITTGYDQYGYNYQGHIFKGYYENYIRPEEPVDSGDTWLIMKWNDAWLSNQDCDGDGLLDRHLGLSSYIGSGAWTTNHQFGTYTGEDGEEYRWNYFVKVVAAPGDAYIEGGIWYTADGVEIGPVIWEQFAIVQEVYNDTGTGEHGIFYLSPAGPGVGKF